MINQGWLFTKQAIQRYLHGIIFLCKKKLSFSLESTFVKLALNFQ